MTAGSDFLYPFLEGDERDVDALLSDLAASAQAKAADSRRLRVATLEESRSALGIAGYDGGAMAEAGLDHCLVVRSDSVHRTQETQAALGFALWTAVHARLTERTSHG